MKHNGGVLFKNVSETDFEFKSTISKNHLNAAGITHGGYLSALVDAELVQLHIVLLEMHHV